MREAPPTCVTGCRRKKPRVNSGSDEDSSDEHDGNNIPKGDNTKAGSDSEGSENDSSENDEDSEKDEDSSDNGDVEVFVVGARRCRTQEGVNGKVEPLVHWDGYPKKECTYGGAELKFDSHDIVQICLLVTLLVDGIGTLS